MVADVWCQNYRGRKGWDTINNYSHLYGIFARSLACVFLCTEFVWKALLHHQPQNKSSKQPRPNPRHCRRVETQTLQETQWFQVVSAKEQTTKSANRRAMNEPSLPAPFLKRQTLVDAEPTSPAELLQAYIARASWWTKAGHLCQVKILCLRVRGLGHLILRLPFKGVGFKRHATFNSETCGK